MRARGGYYDMVIRQMESSSENVWEDTALSS
jgi:hypothetical protein